MSISRAISWLAREHPERLAVRDDDRTVTRAELDAESNILARAYAALGVAQGDLVTVRLPNTVEFVVSCVAIWKLGATPQPLSHRFSLEEQRAVVELADPSLIVGASEGEFPGRCVVGPGFSTPGSPSSDLLSGRSAAPLPDAVSPSWKAPTSSGSTGVPKIILAAADGMIDPEGSAAVFIPREAVQLVSGPLYHSAPFTYAMRGLMTGHSLVVLPRFDERRVLEAIEQHGVTWLLLVPTMMSRIGNLSAEDRRRDLTSLESVLHLGAPIDPDLKRAWIDWLGPDRVVEVYAGTESFGLTMITGSEWLQHPGSVGRPIGGSAVRIVSPEGKELPPGEVGRILLTRRGGPTYRYLGREHPPSVIDGSDRWDTLGDLGRVDSDGYLWVVDREDDLIITGSVNVYPVEVERVLERHPLVRSAVVFGLPDDDLGQRIVAIVDTAGRTLDGAELLRWLGSRLDREKLPRSIEFVAEPVRDDAGKVRRSILAAAHGT